jgi:hypothetical protein
MRWILPADVGGGDGLRSFICGPVITSAAACSRWLRLDSGEFKCAVELLPACSGHFYDADVRSWRGVWFEQDVENQSHSWKEIWRAL